jgi:hypothetical protein
MKLLPLCTLLVVGLSAVSSGAHPATERYVPMGYWTSVGATNTYIGTVNAVTSDASALQYELAGQQRSVRVDERTRIYIDRSAAGQTNLIGTRADLKAGREMEIRFRDDDPGVARWIKLRQ